jgi:hypothetical protein
MHTAMWRVMSAKVKSSASMRPLEDTRTTGCLKESDFALARFNVRGIFGKVNVVFLACHYGYHHDEEKKCGCCAEHDMYCFVTGMPLSLIFLWEKSQRRKIYK